MRFYLNTVLRFSQVKDICNELEVRVLCHKILQNVLILLDADRGSLFLVQGEKIATPNPQNGRLVTLRFKEFNLCFNTGQLLYGEVKYCDRTCISK